MLIEHPTLPDAGVAAALADVVARALAEDLGTGDVTTRTTVPEAALADARIVAKEDVIVCGLAAWTEALAIAGPGADARCAALPDGAKARPGDVIAEASAPARLLLETERVVMNLVCHLGGIATGTARFVAAAGDLRVLDTRKTTPGLRALEKHAVRAGGGSNHRMGLDAGILIKENHIAAAGGLEDAIRGALQGAPHSLVVQCEVRSAGEAVRAVGAGARALLLDNMSKDALRTCLEALDGAAGIFVEASGNMTIERASELAPLAAEGLDAISAGAVIHSRPYADLSMRLELR